MVETMKNPGSCCAAKSWKSVFFWQKSSVHTTCAFVRGKVIGSMKIFDNIKKWLQGLSFRTGVIVLLCCIPFYVLSFAQMLLPISAAAKGILWTILFGLAKTCQYGGLTILGVEGYQRVKSWLRRKKVGK